MDKCKHWNEYYLSCCKTVFNKPKLMFTTSCGGDALKCPTILDILEEKK